MHKQRTVEELREALSRFCHAGSPRPGERGVMSIPMDREHDADMILSDGIDELMQLRASLVQVVQVAQRQPDEALMSALGFDMGNSKWRFGFNGWERQAEDAQAGCFPATDWINEFVVPNRSESLPAPMPPQDSETVWPVVLDL